MLIAIIIIIVIAVILGILHYLFPLVLVCGDSMYPTLKDGDILLSSRISPMFKEFYPTEIYVYRPPVGDRKYVIKRLFNENSEGLYFMGDNRDNSFDSRQYGYVNKKNVVAKCLFVVKKGAKRNDKEADKSVR